MDTTKCDKATDCNAAKYCKHDAMNIQPESTELPGVAIDFPRVDLELCKQCGECEHACDRNAIKMIPI
ncbi:MAG: 4Fe-4S binding protein [Actinobacteria bacterium]|nr:4Fe-4S binding protein [Actinomycetota bacterium]